MTTNQNFALEQLEARHETLWILVPYVTICFRYVWGFPIPYPCVRFRWVWI